MLRASQQAATRNFCSRWFNRAGTQLKARKLCFKNTHRRISVLITQQMQSFTRALRKAHTITARSVEQCWLPAVAAPMQQPLFEVLQQRGTAAARETFAEQCVLFCCCCWQPPAAAWGSEGHSDCLASQPCQYCSSVVG